jgi:diacylglycerol kinase (ATP)
LFSLLGTGNDLARVHGWGAGYSNESLITILEQISESYISVLDRWELTVETHGRKKRVESIKNFFNYFSVGVDAETASQVHYLRENRPEWFFSRFVNKAWYGVLSAEESIKGNSVDLHRHVVLYADGVRVPLPRDSQGIIVLNIDSYAGGVPLWSYGVKGSSTERAPRIRRSQSMGGLQLNRMHSLDRVDSSDDLTALPLTDEERFAKVTACDRQASCQDGFLDIVSVRGLVHLGQCKVGIGNAQRLAQCREIKIVIKKKVAVQIDGEPWRRQVCLAHQTQTGSCAHVASICR